MATPRRRPNAESPSYLNNDFKISLVRAQGDPQKVADLRTAAAEDAIKSGEAIPTKLSELKSLLQQVDPMRTLGALHMMDGQRRAHMPAPANFGSDAMLDLLATQICAEREEDLRPRIDIEFDPRHIWEIERVLNRIANHLLVIATARSVEPQDPERPTPVLNLLKLEHTFDRMAGFDPHVRRVVSNVFAAVDDEVRDRLGFELTHALALSSLYSQVRMIHERRASEAADEIPMPSGLRTEDDHVQWQARKFTYFAMASSPPLESGKLDELLAEQLELESQGFAALIDAVSTDIGSVDDDKVMTDTSLRARPALRLGTGEWFWPRPIDFLHGSMEWALEVCRHDQKLLGKFDKARQSVAERLTGDVLEEVFPSGEVFRNVSYPDVESDAESDTIVSLPGLTLLIETKGGRFTPPGRRGAPARVDKHAKDLVEYAAKQNHRTAQAIRDGKPLLASDGSNVPVSPDDLVVPIVVTLDRIDPFSTFLGEPPGGGREERNWVVNLADLIMIADVLSTPEEFCAYALHRLDMVRDGTMVFVEADCLGHWCEDRTTRLTRFVDEDGGLVRMVDQTSDRMNDFYTQEVTDQLDPEATDRGQRFDKPSSGIPPSVLDSLEIRRLQRDPNWPSVIATVAEVQPPAWKPLSKALASVASSGQPPSGKKASQNYRRLTDGWNVGNKIMITLRSGGDGAPTLDVAIVVRE